MNKRSEALTTLSEANLRAKRAKYPSIPDYALPKTKYRQATANSITKAILDFLQLKGHYASRVQSQGQYNPKLGRWTKSTVKRGIGDITAIINGRSIMIEIKCGKDRMSTWQIETKKQVEGSGGVYLVARSFDEFVEAYDKIIQP